MEWKIECDHCGEFIQIQKNDPVLCPKCASQDIETTEIKIKYKIVVNRYNSWEVMKDIRKKELIFNSEKEADDYVQKYPDFGGDYSRVIRNGNWQVISAEIQV